MQLKQIKRIFTCAMCQGTFPSGWTDADALKELEERHPGVDYRECDMICSECYEKANEWLATLTPEQKKRNEEKF